MNDYKQIYNEWFKTADEKALNFFKDPFTGEVEKENEISYLHATHIGGAGACVVGGGGGVLLMLCCWVNLNMLNLKMS